MNCLFITEEMTLVNQPNCSACIVRRKVLLIISFGNTRIFVHKQHTTESVFTAESTANLKLLISVKLYVSNPYKSTLATLVRFSFRKSRKYFSSVQRRLN